jgi:large repetitive protein
MALRRWRRFTRDARLASLPFWFILWGILSADSCTHIVNIYDERGRLVAVIDLAKDISNANTKNTAVYTYDGSGNVISITQGRSDAVSVITFTPRCGSGGSGSTGTTVTIYGTGFNPTANQNTITFTGATGVPATSASATKLVVTVPAAATTGKITVTVASASGVPGGTADSGTQMFAVDGCGGPTITDFTTCPGQTCSTKYIGTDATAVTVTGTNFDTTAANDRLTFPLSQLAVVGGPHRRSHGQCTSVTSNAARCCGLETRP